MHYKEEVRYNIMNLLYSELDIREKSITLFQDHISSHVGSIIHTADVNSSNLLVNDQEK